MEDPVAYVRGIKVDTPRKVILPLRSRGGVAGAAASEAVVNLGALLTFVGRLDEQQRSDVLQSVQLAQRAADARHDRFAQTRQWYAIYLEVMQRVGWVTQQTAVVTHSQQEGRININQGALGLLANIATQNALNVLSGALETLKGMADEDGTIKLLKFNSVAGTSGNIQIGVAEKDESGSVNLAMGAFQFESDDKSGSVLFAIFGKNVVEFWGSAQKMTLDLSIYSKVRDLVGRRLGTAEEFISNLGPLDSRIDSAA